MEKKQKSSLEMNIIFVSFLLICAATLVDIIPGISASVWAVRIYGIVCLTGVVYCAKKKLFMQLDSFLLMYPEGVQQIFRKINRVLMVLTCALLESALAAGFVHYLGVQEPMSVERGFTGVLYVLSLIVYPITIFWLVRGDKNHQEGGKD